MPYVLVDGIQVTNYGSVGDGVHDDSLILNSLLNATPVGSEIQFPGNHMVGASPILLPDNRRYKGPIGDFNGFTFRQMNGANLPSVLASQAWYNNQTFTGFPLNLEHILVDANSANNSGSNGIAIMNFDSKLLHCSVFNSPSDAILLSALNRNGVQSSNGNVQNRCIHSYVNNSGGAGIHINGSGSNGLTDGYIEDCVIVNTVGSGIQSDHSGGWHFHKNHTSGTNQHGIFANACFASFFEGNYCEGYGDTASAPPGTFYDGIHIQMIGSRAVTVKGNQCYTDEAVANVTYTGISIGAYDTVSVMNAICAENYVVGAGTARGNGYSYYTHSGATTMHVTDWGNATQNVNTPFNPLGSSVIVDNVTSLASIRPNNSSSMFSGTGVPAVGLGVNGDYYFRTDTPGTANQRLYVKTAGAWVGIL